MKVVILAGGFGTRISEESHLKPKPMVEIGEQPILWHIMKYYSQFGYHDFVICLGYKQYVVKEYFADYFLQYGGSQQLFGTVEGDIGGYGPSYDDRRTHQTRARIYR